MNIGLVTSKRTIEIKSINHVLSVREVKGCSVSFLPSQTFNFHMTLRTDERECATRDTRHVASAH